MMMVKYLAMLGAVVSFSVASAAIEIPKASGKALGVTKGKPFSEGLVFVDGRYVEPPYVVERWGNGIRINKIPVIGQVIDWTEFLKTQDGVKITKSENTPAETPSGAETKDDKSETEQEAASDDGAASLDDLFDDDPQPKKATKKAERKIVRKPRPAKPVTTVSYSLDGDFKANDASKALVAKINKVRTDINAILLAGGFICFGERYSRISGDARTAEQILMNLPGIQQSCDNEDGLASGARAAGLVYLTEPVCKDLFRNRRDYLKLKVRRDKMKSDRAFDKMLNTVREKPRY